MNEIEKVYNPTPIYRKNVTVSSLKALKNIEEIVIEHPFIEGLSLRIRKEFMIEKVINTPAIFYGNKFIIMDTYEKTFPQHEVLLDEHEMIRYVAKLLTCKNTSQFYYYRSLERKGLNLGDVIELENGKKGVVTIPEAETFGRNIVYIPINKDGSKSKAKPRLLYGNMEYKKIEGE